MDLPREVLFNISFASQFRGVTETLSYIALGLLARENLFNYLPHLYLLSEMIIKSVSLFHSFSILFESMPRRIEDIDSVGVGRTKILIMASILRVLLPRAQPTLCPLIQKWKILRCSANFVTECTLSSFIHIIVQFMFKER